MSLEVKEYYITEDVEYLGQLEPFKSDGLPTDSIIFKTLPGLGATYLEIDYKNRNNIIIEPNVPVIKGKEAKHLNVLGVYKGVNRKNVLAYLNNGLFPKKIITTPEGYISKVAPVINAHKNFDLFTDFFMLLDECDKLITDVNYRGKIIAPMSDFFGFKGKAMVSATAILPSDPRFIEHNFKVVKLTPTYDYRLDLNLLSTNNIVNALRSTLSGLTNQPIFIFLNSTVTIYTVITALGVLNESKVFCAEDSFAFLRDLGLDNISCDLGGYARYNFLTSRFFSAVDIDLDYKPDVIMITDVNSASHSILDPSTDVIQISGRFRKKEGSKDKVTTNSLTHITNYKPSIEFKTDQQARKYIDSAYYAFKLMVRQSEEAQEEGARTTFTQGHEATEISDFVNDEQELESNMVDNYLHQQHVRSYYRGFPYLSQAYKDCKFFKVQHKALMQSVNDEDNLSLAFAKTSIKITEFVATQLQKYKDDMVPTEGLVYKFYDPQTEINRLTERYPEIAQAFLTIGYDRMKELNFKMHLINKKVSKELTEVKRFDLALVKAIHSEFENDKDAVLEKDAVQRLEPLYLKHGLDVTAYAKDLIRYFHTNRKGDKNGKKVYPLNGKKFNSI